MAAAPAGVPEEVTTPVTVPASDYVHSDIEFSAGTLEFASTAEAEQLLFQNAGQVTILDAGVGRVFRIVTEPPICCADQQERQRRVSQPAQRRRTARPSETRFAAVARIALCSANWLAAAAAALYAVPRSEDHGTAPGEAEGDRSRFLRTDSFGPLGAQVILLAWLGLVRWRLLKLDTGARGVAAATSHPEDRGPSETRSSMQQHQALWRGSLAVPQAQLRALSPTVAPANGVPDTRPTATDPQVQVPLAPVVDLETLFFSPMPTGVIPGEDGRFTAADLIRLISYRGAQPGLFSPAFCGVGRLPEGHNFGKCGKFGICLGGAQTAFLRLISLGGDSPPWARDRQEALDAAVWWISTVYFFIAFSLLYSLLALLCLGHRQQYLLMRRFTALLVERHAAKLGQPYLTLNTRANLSAWYAVREYLLVHTTLPNVLRVAVDTTAAGVLLTVIAAAMCLIIRTLFQRTGLDLLNKVCLSFVVVHVPYICIVIYYGVLLQGQIAQHASVLAHVQWNITKLWYERTGVEGPLQGDSAGEVTPPRRASAAPAAGGSQGAECRQLWAMREYVRSLQRQCEEDPSVSAKILGASLESLRWFLIVFLLVLNPALFFAIRQDGHSVGDARLVAAG